MAESNESKTSHEDEAFKRYVLKKSLEILKNKSGFHTALISLFVPASRKISDAISYLKNEINESSNIKSKTNRKNVLDSITMLIQRLKLYKEVPPNGLVLYAGQIPVNNAAGTERSELYVIEPPEPIQTFKYYCSSQFLLDPLYDMIKEKGAWGIINIESKEAAIGWVRGSHVQIERTMTSGVHGKFSAGGQSQRRFERLIEEGVAAFFGRVAEASNAIFLEMPDLRGIFVSGAGMTKNKFIDSHLMDYRLEQKIVDAIDVAYSGESGIRETIMKIQDRIQSVRWVQEKKIFTRFMNEVARDTGKAIYGEKDVRKALDAAAVDLLILSEKLQKKRVFIECPACNFHSEQTIKPEEMDKLIEQIRTMQCPQCKSNQYQYKEDKDLVEELGELAEKSGTKVELLSTETEEGDSLFSTFGGVAAILRYQM